MTNAVQINNAANEEAKARKFKEIFYSYFTEGNMILNRPNKNIV